MQKEEFLIAILIIYMLKHFLVENLIYFPKEFLINSKQKVLI